MFFPLNKCQDAFIYIKYHILICLPEWILCWDYLFIQMDIKISLYVYILLYLLWLPLLSNCVSGFIYYLFPFQKFCWDWLQICIITPCCSTNNPWWALSGPQHPIDNKRLWQHLKHVKGPSFPWHRFIIDFLREVAFPTDLGEPDDLKKRVQKEFRHLSDMQGH